MQLVRHEARNEVNQSAIVKHGGEHDEVTYANDYGDSRRNYLNKSTANAAAQSLPNIQKLDSHRGKQPTMASAARGGPSERSPGNGDSKRAEGKAYADIRVKLGGARKSPGKLDASPNLKVGGGRPVRDDDAESIPSAISEDMWGELPKYQYRLHQNQMKKAKEDLQRKKEMVRNTLDSQLKEQQERKVKDIADAKEMDRLILARAQHELDEEKRKQAVLKQKTLEAKDQRDHMLKQSLALKEAQFKRDRKKELEEVYKLQEALDKEKKDK